MVMAVLVSLERRIALDLRHAFEIIITSEQFRDGVEQYLSILYTNGGEVLEETFTLPKETDTKALLRFLAECKNISDKVIIYEDLVDGFKQTKEEEAISTIRKLKAENEKLKADNERLRKTVCDLMGDIHRLHELLEKYEDDEDDEDEIIPVAVRDDD